MKNQHYLSAILLPILSLAFLTGCPPKNKLDVSEESAIEEKMAEGDEAMGEDESDYQITQDWAEIPALKTVIFDYDSSTLSTRERTVLKANVDVIKKLPSTVLIRVAGHCDDRGTIEYNIALGQRRANIVKNYYSSAGIAASRIQTISYGEERPLCTQENEACWSRNRRGETQVRNPEPITVGSDELQ